MHACAPAHTARAHCRSIAAPMANTVGALFRGDSWAFPVGTQPVLALRMRLPMCRTGLPQVSKAVQAPCRPWAARCCGRPALGTTAAP